MMRFQRWIAVALSVLPLAPAVAGTLEGKDLVVERCASCHDLVGPAPDTFAGLMRRPAPDLFYAGSKFNRPWLVRWLEKPTLIRRAGVMYLKAVVNRDGKDQIDPSKVTPCASNLNSEEAASAADYLMTLKDPKLKIGVVNVAKKLRKHKALRMFSKQQPCIGCHAVRVGKRIIGGISGPDLRDAGTRLNPDWVYARIENPQYWDPKTWMPRIEMSHKKREMLTLFVISMKMPKRGEK